MKKSAHQLLITTHSNLTLVGFISDVIVAMNMIWEAMNLIWESWISPGSQGSLVQAKTRLDQTGPIREGLTFTLTHLTQSASLHSEISSSYCLSLFSICMFIWYVQRREDMTSHRSENLDALITFQGQESRMQDTRMALWTKSRWALSVFYYAKPSGKSKLVIMAHLAG